MFCPNCGKEIPNESKFCGSCGANLSDVISESVDTEKQTPIDAAATPVTDNPSPEFVQFRKKPGKKKLIGIVAIVAVVIVALFALKSVFSGGSSNNAYVYLSDGKYELLTNIEKDEYIEIASGKNDTVKSNLLSFSPDGKYIYYYTKYDSSTRTGSLCRAEYGKLKENTSKNDKYIEIIATNVSLGFRFLNDGSVIYKNGSETLYYYNGSESEQIAKSVNYYYTDEADRVAYVTGDYSEGYTLYGIKLSAIDDKVKLASNFYYICDATDLDNILYIKQEDDSSETLYVVGFEKDSEKVGEGVSLTTYGNGKTYFTEKNGFSLNLYDYVVDDYADADSGITEPNKEDYAIPIYGYYTMSSSSNPSDYEEIYTSCTNAAAFYRSWFSYRSLEYAAQNASENQDVYKAFVDKYKSQEDENGYIVVTDTIKSDLISLANTCGQGYDGEWMELCFYKEQNGTSYDYDTYNADCDKFYEAKDRIEMRATLKDTENEYPIRTLYCYENGKLTAINENVLSTRSFDGAIMFNTSEHIADTVDITNVTSISSVTQLFDVNYELQNYVVTTDNATTYQMSASAAETFAEAYGEYDADLYFAGDKVYMSSDREDSPLSVAAITDGKIDDFTILTDDAAIISVDGSTIYYSSEYYENNDYPYCDLYSYDGKESKCLAQDVLFDNINLYENGDVLAYTGYRNYSGYELTLFNSNGEKTIIGDNITQYIRVDKSTLLYISDDDLYVYDGKSKSLVHTDVEWLWSLNSMGIQQSFGYYENDSYD